MNIKRKSFEDISNCIRLMLANCLEDRHLLAELVDNL